MSLDDDTTAIASNGTQFLVVAEADGELRGVRVSPAGAMLDPGGSAISTPDGNFIPEVAFAAERTCGSSPADPTVPNASEDLSEQPEAVRGAGGEVGPGTSAFAKAMGISVHTLRNWEQGRRHPEGPAIALLRIAARHPRIIRENIESAA